MGSPADLALQLAGHPYALAFLSLLATGLGLPVPEDVILLAAGAVVAWQDASYYPMVGVCLSGILVGDLIMYGLGARFGLPLLRARPLRYIASERSMERALASFRTYGAWAVFTGRFLAGIRAMVFFTAGASGVHWATFVLMDFTAALLSVPLLVLVGYAFGSELQSASSLLHASRWQIAGGLVVLLFAGWVALRVWRALGLGARLARTITGLGRAGAAYLGKRRILRLTLLGALAAVIALYAGLSLRRLPDTDRNHRAVAAIGSLAPGDSYAFAVVGSSRRPSGHLARILAAIDGDERVLFTVTLGDMVFDGEPEKYRHLLRQLAAARKPVVAAVGSNELSEGGRALFYEVFGPYYFAFRVGGDAFLVLENAETGRFSASQWSWAEQTLAAERSARFRFAFFHLPLAPEPGLPSQPVDWRDALVLPSLRRPDSADPSIPAPQAAARFRELGLTRAFASTAAGQREGEWEGLPYSLTGGAGAGSLSREAGAASDHYLRVQVGPEGAVPTFVPVTSPTSGILPSVAGFLLLHVHSFFATHPLEVAVFALLAALAWDLYIHRVRGPTEPG